MAPMQGGQLASICLSFPFDTPYGLITHHTATAQQLSLPADSQSTEDPLQEECGVPDKGRHVGSCSRSAMNVLCNCQKEPTLPRALVFPPVKAEGAQQEDLKITSTSPPRDGDAKCIEMA